METPEILTETLALERIEVNTFRGVSPEDGPGRIFGGQVIAQSLLAAYETVEDRICHSLHCYFIRPGDTTPVTIDFATCPGLFWLQHLSAPQLDISSANLRKQLWC